MMALVERDKESFPNRTALARTEDSLARIYQQLGEVDATRKALEQCRAQLEYLLAHNSPRPGLRYDLGAACQQLGVTWAKLLKWAEASKAAEDAARYYRAELERTPKSRRAYRGLTEVLGNRASAQRHLGNYPEALRSTEERVRMWPNGAPELYDAATDFGRTYDAISRAKEPDPQLRDRALKNILNTLRQALRAGFTDYEQIRTDVRFIGVRGTVEFQAFLMELPDKKP
jgi:tetratricopeptide (TPR) repeat protein